MYTSISTIYTMHYNIYCQVCVANPPDDLTKSGCPVYDPGCDCDEEDEVSTCPGDTRSQIFFVQF